MTSGMFPNGGSRRRPLACLPAVGAIVLLLAACAGTPSTPIADTGPIDLVGNCAQSDDDGFREQAHLDVRQGSVRALDWQILVGNKGSCRFALDAFQQTRSRGHIELVSKDRSGCKLLVYQDPRRVTLAHAGCESRCTNGIHEQAWPVMFDPRSGGCANLNR
jgi:hypothetical protein